MKNKLNISQNEFQTLFNSKRGQIIPIKQSERDLKQRGSNKQLSKEGWRLQQESNLHFSLRRTTLYPFNYGADARNSNRN